MQRCNVALIMEVTTDSSLFQNVHTGLENHTPSN